MSKLYYQVISIVIIYSCFINTLIAQKVFNRVDTIPVKVDGNWLKNPWVGGHNFVQLSDIDLDGDGKKDLFLFDRTGNRVTTYLNHGTSNTVDYIYAPKYETAFPHLEDWAILRDYNCDGKPDVFTYAVTPAGVKVWKNISTPGNLKFELVSPYIKSMYGSSLANLYVVRTDIPVIDDIDGDGDLDILTIDAGGVYMEFHQNQSKERGYGCDSLIFNLTPNCWGNFKEDMFDCTIYLNNCRSANIEAPPFYEDTAITRHSGNCAVCFDINGDGVKEVLLGQISCCNMVMLTNGGTPTNAIMTNMDTAFPKYNIPAMPSNFPCGYFLDVNNDNKRDLIISPNAPNISINVAGLWYYQNIGEDNAVKFKRVKRNLLQGDMIDVGEGSDPVFFDFTGDGLTDLIVSNYVMIRDSCKSSQSTNVYAYKNIGTATKPAFELTDTTFTNFYNQLPDLKGKHLTFGDLDGDGDADMMVGDEDGVLHYFENTAGSGKLAIFVLKKKDYTDNKGTVIDIGSYSTPQLIDIDRDGDLDLIIGERSGNLNYYENIGTPTSPSFELVTESFGGVDTYKPCCTGYSQPFIFDSAGTYRMIVGSEANALYNMGWLWYYKNIDGNLNGNFTLVDSMYQHINEGERMLISGKDINGDSKMDLVIGNYRGGIALYLGDSAAVNVNEIEDQRAEFIVFPNPSSGEINISLLNFIPNQNYEVEVVNPIGQTVFSQPMRSSRLKITQYLPQGIYFCNIRTVNSLTSRKIVILK